MLPTTKYWRQQNVGVDKIPSIHLDKDVSAPLPPNLPHPHHVVLSLWSVQKPQWWISVMASIVEVVSIKTDIGQ